MIINPFTPAGRALLAAALVIALGVVACTVPTTYEAEMGKSFTIGLPPGTDMPSVEKALAALQDERVADEVNLSVTELAGSGPQMELMLWGDRVDEAKVRRILAAQNEAFAKASWEIAPLEGPVRSNLAGKLGHDIFNVDLLISEGDVESARRQIVEQLAAQGLKGNVDIQYSDGEDGRQNIEVRLTDVETDDPSKAPGEVGVIELKSGVVTGERQPDE